MPPVSTPPTQNTTSPVQGTQSNTDPMITQLWNLRDKQAKVICPRCNRTVQTQTSHVPGRFHMFLSPPFSFLVANPPLECSLSSCVYSVLLLLQPEIS